MDCIEKECTFLYKHEFNSWIENQKEGGKFESKNVELVKLIAAKAEEDQESVSPFIIDNCVGSLYFTVNISDLELFTFTDKSNGTVTTFRLSLEGSNLECLSSGERENVSKGDASQPTISDLSMSYQPKYLCGLIKGSKNGSKFLAFTADGRILLMDWTTKMGVIVGKWPVKPDSGCYGLVAYEPNISGAISGDGTLIAAIGPSCDNDDDYDDKTSSNGDPECIEIRIFDVNVHQFSVKKLLLDQELGTTESDISYMSFNPYYSNLLYLMFNPDFGNKFLLIVYDHEQEKILAKRNDAQMMGHFSFECNYETLDGPVFIHHGNIIITYLLEDENTCHCIFLLDAFNLDLVATVKLSHTEIALKYHFLVSKCQTKIVVFKRNDNVDEIDVYKIPNCDISLKNLCRRKITGQVDKGKVDELTMLPSTVRDYLRL